MRGLIRTLTGVVAAVTSYAITKRATKCKPADFEWLDGGAEVNGPLFEAHEWVITRNPYTLDYTIVDFDGSPLYGRIEDVEFDEDDGQYRYLIDGGWYAESWLLEPAHPFMEKVKNEEGKFVLTYSSFEENGDGNGNNGGKPGKPVKPKKWADRADELLDEYNAHVKAGNTDEADEVMRTFMRESAMHQAGQVIRECGGRLSEGDE